MLRDSLGKVVHTVKRAGTYAAKVSHKELHKIAVHVRAVRLTPSYTMPLALPKVQEFQSPGWLYTATVANWPKVRPDNSKGVDQKCERSVKIFLVLARFYKKAEKWPNFYFSLLLPV